MEPLERGSLLMRYSKWIRETSEPRSTIKKNKTQWDRRLTSKTWKLSCRMTIN